MFKDKNGLRKKAYGVGLGITGVLLVYGIATQEELAAWLVLFGALLSLAFTNVNTEEEAPTRTAEQGPLHDDYWE